MAKFTFQQTTLEKASEAYHLETSHRFMVYSYALLILLFYELLLGISRTPHVTEYEGTDLWFKVLDSFFQYGTRTFSVLIAGYLGYWLYMDWFGRKTPKQLRMERKLMKIEEKFKPRPRPPYRPNWYYFGFQAVEGFAYGTLIYLLLKVIVWLILLIPYSDLPIPKAMDASPSMIHHFTNPIQDVALAFGAGFYEELLFRYLLFWGLLNLAGTNKRFSMMKSEGYSVPHLPGSVPKYNLRDSGFVMSMVIGSMLYSWSHYLFYFGDVFSLYSFFYRFLFGLIMYYIFVRRHISIAMLAHVVHDFWYFLLR